jgi:hypothetical protein
MDIFKKTQNGVVQHGPCPGCGEWGCICGEWSCYAVDPARKVTRKLEEIPEQLRKSLDEFNSFGTTPVVPT